MSDISSGSGESRSKIDLLILLSLCAAIIFFVGAGFLSYSNIQVLQRNSNQVIHTHQVILDLDDLLSIMKDAETGQRGFLITDDEAYLEPYTTALTRVQNRLDELDILTRDSPAQNSRLPEMTKHIRAKLDELKETIDLRRKSGFNAARDVVLSDRGKSEMDVLRAQILTTQTEEYDIRTRRIAEMESAYHSTIISGFLTCLLGVLLSLAIATLLRRAALTRQHQDWLQKGQVNLAEAVVGDPTEDRLSEQILKRVAEYLGAPVGAFFLKDGDRFKRISTYGVPADGAGIDSFRHGDGLLGQATKDQRSFVVKEVPDNYIKLGSAFGSSKPRHLVICPAVTDGVTNAVLEIGFVQAPGTIVLELLQTISEAIAVAVRSANYRSNLQNLLEETQRQAEELQAQGEELRVNNEELEEQSRTLKESQSRLEQQQAELEQTNAQLEEQAQLLEVQRDDLARANDSVRQKAQELEKSSQYKSDFLANMSHELRTPLNSSLILAKLLADNPQNNLSEEQVKFARTIQSSGNDLLMLINDILDLSKIEAGHMVVRPETFPIERLSGQLNRVFAPVAGEKGLELKMEIALNCPATLETDPQRLEQILKNLLSNSIKFTEHGQVTLTIDRAPDNCVSFAVSDTGIGIAPENQNIVFEAFRQADGTINRKYGGTGLGLSISRELARLLGGTINLESEYGKGSTFTLIIPEVYTKLAGIVPPVFSEDSAKPLPMPAKRIKKDVAPNNVKKASKLEDDRERLQLNERIILIVEDDASFARILYDLAHEHGFQCLLANSVEEALYLTSEYLPSAVLLDVGLPDHSGLTVLDQLKRDRRTRHIPVHVISGNDYTQTALSMGAVGYMLKPVKRDQIEDVLSHLKQRLTKEMKRVLIVEDNATQRDSIMKLLAAQKVEPIGVGTATECLEQLKTTVFDCMVLDISLPDATGYSLLETLSKEAAYSFPPVIVYTGRDLSPNEEQLLRRYSSAIIIKGAKSPERLLDEVTLFLHQVVSELPPEQQRILATVKNRDETLQGRRILAVEDDVRNVYALTSIFEPLGVNVQIARHGREAIEMLEKSMNSPDTAIDLVLMDVMMPEMDGLTATREIRKKADWKKLPIIMLTAKAMKDDQENCLEAGANDYMAKPLDVEKLLSLVRVWMPR